MTLILTKVYNGICLDNNTIVVEATDDGEVRLFARGKNSEDSGLL